jgi:energy-coupling factor transport system substrate-specific component
MNTSGRGGLNSTALALIPLAIAINIVIGQLVTGLPIYLDSIGTVLVGALLGPWMGLLTGVLANVIWTLLGNPVPIYFAYVAGVIGLLAGFAGRAGFFQRPSPRWLSAIIGGIFLFALTLFVLMFLNRNPDPNAFPPFPTAAELIQQYVIVFIVTTLIGLALGYFVLQRAGYAGLAGLVTGVVAAIISAPMAAYYFGGVTGAGTDLLVAAFRASGSGILESTLAQGTVSDPFDKMTSFILVWLIIQSLPRRLLMRFPNSRAFDEAQSLGRPAASR